MTSEIVTYVMIGAILLAVAFGLFVSSERDSMVDQAQASIAAIKQHSELATADSKALVCSNAMVTPEILANDFLTLTIKPILKDEEDHSAGFGPGLHIRSNKEEDGSDTFITAQRLFDSLQEALEDSDEDRLREHIKEDEKIEYFVLISDRATCVDHTQLTNSDTPNETPSG